MSLSSASEHENEATEEEVSFELTVGKLNGYELDEAPNEDVWTEQYNCSIIESLTNDIAIPDDDTTEYLNISGDGELKDENNYAAAQLLMVQQCINTQDAVEPFFVWSENGSEDR